MTETPTVGCLFSGMGGFASGLASAGFKLIWANDIDPSACTTFRHRFPGVIVVEKDVKDLSVGGDKLPGVDVLIGGFPCQSFSQAGDRRGFDDPRGELFLEIPRLLQEYGSQRRPSLVVLENVPHLLYGADGTWFERVRYSLRKAGYWFRRESCWTVNVHHATDLPQDRTRLFMVAASRDQFSYNPFTPPPKNIRNTRSQTIHDLIDRSFQRDRAEYLRPENKYYKMISYAMKHGQSDTHIYQLRRSYVREKTDGLCPTLTANMGLGGHNVPFIRDKWGIRRLSVDEVAHLQGFDDVSNLFPELSSNNKYRLLGNAVCAKLAKRLATTCFEILEERQ